MKQNVNSPDPADRFDPVALSAPMKSKATGVLPSYPTYQQDGLRRSGFLGWWLNLTAPHWPTRPMSIAERERLRKAELTSYSILAIFACLVALISNSFADPGTAVSVGAIAFFSALAALLNRAGQSRFAAYLIPSVMMLFIAAAVLQLPGGLRLVAFPTFDLFVIPIVLVSIIGDRRSPWVFAIIAIAFVVGDFFQQPHAVIPGTSFDDLAAELKIFGAWGILDRHITLLFFAAFFGWMGARSVDTAIARADRAEEIARLEHAIAEQRRQLEQGIETIRQTHVRVANGDFSARAPLEQEHILWQVAYSLNNLIQRLQRSADAEHVLTRTKTEIDRLLQEIQRAKQGLQPLWPQPSGTPLDPLLNEFSSLGGSRRGF